ncbi:hypothetical protein [Streptomyces sp. NPDC049040]|uniref:hypothetical protein n=1 Tax=Streptomyces sp. NPDC049040 TaxID=3365593 RepID=UPI0037187B5A
MRASNTHRRRRGTFRPVPTAAAAAGVAALSVAAYLVVAGPDHGAAPLRASAGRTTAAAAVAPSATGPTAPAARPTASGTGKPTATATPRRSHAASGKPAKGTTTARGLGGCEVAAPGSIWRTPVDRLPVLAASATYVGSIGAGAHVHADFGSGTWDGGPIGIPVTTTGAGTPAARVTFDYADESDKGPYRIPADAQVEGGPQADGDRHVIVVDTTTCRDYELWDSHPQGNGSWHAGSGAVFGLTSHTLRPDGWTSADAAGLPVLPGLARYDEASRGVIGHALRITVPRSQAAHLWPARHDAGSADRSLPPMGLRLRLKGSVDISRLPPQARAIAQTLKTYGAIVADNGSAWYVSGAPDSRWDNDQLQQLGALDGSDFEAVDVSSLRISAGSDAARQP